MTFGEAMVLSVQREVHIRLTDMHSEDALSLIQDAYITSYAVRFDRIRFTAFASVLSGRNVHLHLCGKFEVRQASNGQVVAHARP